jgi:uncharacterized Zn-finger protein
MKFEFVTSKIVPAESAGGQRAVPVRSTDLPLHCPSGTASRWNMHPRVYIPVERHKMVKRFVLIAERCTNSIKAINR